MIVRNNEDVKFTVDMAGLRGSFFRRIDAKKEAMRLVRLNPDDSVMIEDVDGNPKYYFYFQDGKMMMTHVRYTDTVVVNEQ